MAIRVVPENLISPKFRAAAMHHEPAIALNTSPPPTGTQPQELKSLAGEIELAMTSTATGTAFYQKGYVNTVTTLRPDPKTKPCGDS